MTGQTLQFPAAAGDATDHQLAIIRIRDIARDVALVADAIKQPVLAEYIRQRMAELQNEALIAQRAAETFHQHEKQMGATLRQLKRNS